MTAKNFIGFFLALLILPVTVEAQVNWFPKLRKQSAHAWEESRFEIFMAGGAANYLGELGGLDRPRSALIFDVEPTKTRYAVSAGARYYVGYQHAFTGTFSYARVSGDDQLTNYPNRRLRNLHFRSQIMELSGRYEFHIIRPFVRHSLNIRRTIAFNGRRFGLYSFLGFGGFYYNPKAQYEGSWVALQPLGTEGQGLEGGPRPYSRFALSFPMGIGLVYQFRKYQLGFEYGLRLTNTDYLDDASTRYYDNDKLREARGDMAADLANPHISTENPEWYGTNGIRGNPRSNDSYMFAQITFSRSFGAIINLHNPKAPKKYRSRFAARNPKEKGKRNRRTRAKRSGSLFR